MVKKFIVISVLLLTSHVAAAGDPTRPILPKSKAATSQKAQSAAPKQPLTAIFTRNQKRFAIIEGKQYRNGESYNGDRILKIYSNKVLLRSSGGNYHLTLIPKIKK